jgi:hypothetical protein
VFSQGSPVNKIPGNIIKRKELPSAGENNDRRISESHKKESGLKYTQSKYESGVKEEPGAEFGAMLTHSGSQSMI